MQITLGSHGGPAGRRHRRVKLLVVLTLLTLAPSILLLMTCFTRVAIVPPFVRTALQLQGTPANQIIIGLSLFITYFVMAPVWDNINRDALTPYFKTNKSPAEIAMDRATGHLRTFMLEKQTLAQRRRTPSSRWPDAASDLARRPCPCAS